MNTITTNDTILEPPSSTVEPEPFVEEAQWILREHEMVLYDQESIIERSARIGEELIRIQKGLPYGKWGDWAKRNLKGISERHLRRYKAIARRKNEPRALEDPAGFLAEIYGNVDTDDPSSDVNVRSGNDEGKPPPKRTSKSRKAKAPPTTTPPPAPKPLAVGKVSLEIAFANAAEALEKAVGDWKRIVDDWKKGSLAPLMEGATAAGNARIAAGLGTVEKDLDSLVEMVETDRDALVERLRGFAQEVAS
jgi:hypothetical protein